MNEGISIRRTFLEKIDEGTLLPISFILVIGGLFYWGASVQSANLHNEAKIERLTSSIEVYHAENLRRHDQAQKTLMEIQRSMGIVEGKMEFLNQGVQQGINQSK